MRERERERVHKILFGLIIAVAVFLYAAFNVWVYQYSKNGKVSSPGLGVLQGDSLPFKAQGKPQGVTFTDSNASPVIPNASPVIPADAGIQRTIPPTLFPTPTPTPRPTGPGEYACDPYGVCNRYGEAARKEFCTITFADRFCLDQCGDKSKQCKK